MNERQAHLIDLADSYGVDIEVVTYLADLLGPTEDYDGLVTMVQDYAGGYL